jgi:hypothetical protein
VAAQKYPDEKPLHSDLETELRTEGLGIGEHETGEQDTSLYGTDSVFASVIGGDNRRPLTSKLTKAGILVCSMAIWKSALVFTSIGFSDADLKMESRIPATAIVLAFDDDIKKCFSERGRNQAGNLQFEARCLFERKTFRKGRDERRIHVVMSHDSGDQIRER